jgi:hypothetical protein
MLALSDTTLTPDAPTVAAATQRHACGLERPMPCAAIDHCSVYRNLSMLLCVILLWQHHHPTELRVRHR